MAVWRDILSPVPQEGQRIWFRRYPQATPPAFGVWSDAAHGVVAGPGKWEIEHNQIAAWRPLAGPDPEWPGVALPLRTWRDPFWYPPKPEQCGWVRRWDQDCIVILCQWDESARTFGVRGTGHCIPWSHIYKWKPS